MIVHKNSTFSHNPRKNQKGQISSWAPGWTKYLSMHWDSIIVELTTGCRIQPAKIIFKLRRDHEIAMWTLYICSLWVDQRIKILWSAYELSSCKFLEKPSLLTVMKPAFFKDMRFSFFQSFESCFEELGSFRKASYNTFFTWIALREKKWNMILKFWKKLPF